MLQELTYSSKPKRALEEFMKRDNALRGCGLERGGCLAWTEHLRTKTHMQRLPLKLRD